MKKNSSWLVLPFLSLPLTAIANNAASTPSTPLSTQTIKQFSSLPVAMLPTRASTVSDSVALELAIRQYAQANDPLDTRALHTFLQQHPDSVWSAALWYNLGTIYQQAGQYMDATDAYRQASQQMAQARTHSPELSRMGDGIYAAELMLHTRLGHAADVTALLKDSDKHQSGVAASAITQAIAGAWEMQHSPATALRCGTGALAALLTPAAATHLDDIPAPATGFSLRDLQSLAKAQSLPMRAVESRDAIPVPSVVHWKSGHYAAIVAKQGDSYQIKDPVLGQEASMRASSILRESSGHYLVTPQWQAGRELSADEAGRIYGAGYTTSNDATATSPDDKKDCNECSNGAGSSAGNGPTGMPRYAVSSMLVSLNIEDVPVGYKPPVGSAINFKLDYNELEASQPATFTFSNIGTKWSHNWMAWVQDNPNSIGSSVSLVTAGGGSRALGGYSSSTGKFAREVKGGAIIKLVSTSPITYQRDFPDGSKEIYAQSDNSTSTTRRVFLTSRTDADGNTVTLNYDSQLRLASLTDAIGQQTTFTYGDTTHPYIITAVTDPFNRTAQLEYDSSQRLTAITDAASMRSSFVYSSAGVISSMTTPYGTSSFTSYTSGTTRYLEATDPAGNTERVEFRHSATGIAYSESPVPTTPSSVGLFNSYLDGRNTFYWDKTAYKAAKSGTTMDYTKALIHHWYHEAGLTYNTYGVEESIKYPLERRIWFNYPGQTWSASNGTLNKPSYVLRVLPDGTTQNKAYTYNDYGNVLTYTDPKGRITTYTYATNGQDILTVKQGTKTIASYTWNDKHKPLTETDAAGKVTTYTYNDRNQVLTKTNALSEVTTWQYDTNGYLLKILGPASKTLAKYTYDTAGRVLTYSDAESYVLAYEYDNLDRLTKITYPDSTTQTYTWDKLNVASSQDRLGRTTSYTYDALGRLTAETDPMSKTTQYGYYENGRLKTLTDARGKTTTWNRDIEGRVTSKVLADGKTTTLTYDTSSRLISQLDAAGQTKSFTYTADDQVASIAYTSASNPTTGVSFTYDTTFPYVTAMTDATGTTSYTYVDAGQNGALQPLTETPPSPRQVISYTYDDLSRTKTRTVGSQTEQWTYDDLGRVSQDSNALGVFDYTYFMNSSKVYSEALQGTTWRTDYRYGTVVQDRQLQQILHPTTISVAKSVFMGHDAAGRIVTRHDWPEGQHDQYQYDDADRVKQVQRGVWQGLRQETEQPLWTTPAIETSTYTYDDGDNITDILRPSSHQTYTVNDVNQMVSRNSLTPTYDANGNVLDDGYYAYTWDAENRLKTVTKKSTSAVSTFGYDGLSRRISITEQSTDTSGTITTSTTYYQWCGETLCQALDGSGNTTERYAPQGEQVNGDNRYYARDAQGTVMQMVSASGTLLGNLRYDAYGAPEVKSGTVPRFGYAGMFRHAASGLNLTLYRAYHPQIGRWLSRDPIGENGGINLYGYVGGDPVKNIDPMGLDPMDGSPFAPFNSPNFHPMPYEPKPDAGVNQVMKAWGDFWHNYNDMRDANTINADKYFHCKANCEATKRGQYGKMAACTISDTREWADQNIKRDPESASAADQAANTYGRSGAMSPYASCSSVCAPFRPNGLPANY